MFIVNIARTAFYEQRQKPQHVVETRFDDFKKVGL